MGQSNGYAVVERRGSKNFGMAKWIPENDHTCLATAEAVFRAHGFNGVVWWMERTEQKNFAGWDPHRATIECTNDEAHKIVELMHARAYIKMGLDWEYYSEAQTPDFVTQSDYEALEVANGQ